MLNGTLINVFLKIHKTLPFITFVELRFNSYMFLIDL